ncbi:glycosyltransferase family protein [Novosphingobium aquimarinum]|uniref:glucuronosyltransferase n=1 Tax=Novosphingobium aquimarinum TaxID=2682494 RepID=UPI0012EBA4F8|nr:glucuronosyltransferase [Novosphingobium aquimarinum]
MLRSDAVLYELYSHVSSCGRDKRVNDRNRGKGILHHPDGTPKLLVAASKGGHWDQVMMLRDVFAPYSVAYATTDRNLSVANGTERAYDLPDCNRHTPLLLLQCFLISFWTVWRFRPNYVVSTGALPGLLCILFGRLLGAETIWVDSVANAERLSMCGRVATCVATVTLTQWEHLARPEGPSYVGSIL